MTSPITLLNFDRFYHSFFAFSALTLLVGHQGAGMVICLERGANDLHIAI